MKVLQQRLIDAGYFKLRVTGIFNIATGKAVDGIREKNFYSQSYTVNSKVLRALWSMTGKRNRVPSICLRKSKAICISKRQKVLRFYKRGKLVQVLDARFGQPSTPTRNGNWRVFSKIPNGTSSLTHTWMPWAMYFSGGEAVHYSPGFNDVGYYGASHGCVNIRDYKGVKWLYRQTRIGTFLKVYK